MKTPEFDQPLSDAELDRIGEFLASSVGSATMNLEELDGFFCSLVAGPELSLPGEFLPEVFGGDPRDNFPAATLDEIKEISALLLRYWNGIYAVLESGKPYLPKLYEDEDGQATGNDWAYGFMCGVSLQPEGWSEYVIGAEDNPVKAALAPILVLAHEQDPDPAHRPPLISHEQRIKLLAAICVGLTVIFRFFSEIEEMEIEEAAMVPETLVRGEPKIGRNERCPCGSGKKYKHCCGG